MHDPTGMNSAGRTLGGAATVEKCGERSVRTDSSLERGGFELAVPRRIYSREKAPRVGALLGRLSWNKSVENIVRLQFGRRLLRYSPLSADEQVSAQVSILISREQN